MPIYGPEEADEEAQEEAQRSGRGLERMERAYAALCHRRAGLVGSGGTRRSTRRARPR